MSRASFNPLTSIRESLRRAAAAAASLVAAVLFMLATPMSALASATVGAATGGTGMIVGNSYALSGPSVTEGATGDIAAGTITLTLPAGFVFNAGSITATATNTTTTGGPCTPAANRLQINGGTSQTVTVANNSTSASIS
ncbi:MAG TPA: hypothetical protein VFG86_09030, partial [Chloroflexota bacterium]|nr:hypothetical protein [Chloroflexota bacterium]